MAEPYLVAKIRAWAEFPEIGVTFDDVISVSATFALNSIPTASVVVAVGRAFDKGAEKTATIYKAKEKIKPRTKAEVFVEITDLVGTQIGVTPGKYKVFSGYVAGMGYQRSYNHANYVINLIHWLDDLNNSSAINGNWSPGVPHDWAQQAMYDRIGPGGSLSTFSPTPGVEAKFAKISNLRTDLWENTIKPLLKAVAGFHGDEKQERNPPPRDPKLQNDAALEALKKMPGDSPTYVPLKLKVDSESANLSKSIAAFFSQTLGTSFAQNTMWAKLINDYASQFFFAISPAVDWATPIPFCAGLSLFGVGGIVITAKEYNYANFNANMTQLLEAVYVHYPVASATNLPKGPSDARLSFYRPWASWPPEGQAKKGLKLFKNIPAWLANLDFGWLRTAYAVRNRTDSQDKRSAGPPPVSENGPIKESGPAHKENKPLALRIAQHWYYTEILQQRYGEFAGPFRVDIAPGSIIQIQTPPRDQDLGDSNPFVVASVISVSYVIDAERATAGTSFTIAHQKTSEEDKDPLYATPVPPLYAEPWWDGPLTESM